MRPSVSTMAYLRKEKEIVDVDFPISRVWEAISKSIASLEWTIQESNETTHETKAKTKQNFMAYPSVITISATPQNEKTTRVTISAETPVTTITGIVDFGRTQQRVDSFLLALTKQLKPEGTATIKKES